MSHVFISYNRKDQKYVRTLAQDIRKHGFDVWYDEQIEPGERWWHAIDDAIRGCAAFLVVMTPEAGESEWVEREIQIAQNEKKPIFPLLLRGKPFTLLIDTQYLDVTGNKLPPEDFYERLSKIAPRKAQSGVYVSPPQDVQPGPATPPQRQTRQGWLPFGVIMAVIVVVLVYVLVTQVLSNSSNAVSILPFPTTTQSGEVVPFESTISESASSTAPPSSTRTPEPTSIPTTLPSPSTPSLEPTTPPPPAPPPAAAIPQGAAAAPSGAAAENLTESAPTGAQPPAPTATSARQGIAGQLAFQTVRDGNWEVYVLGSDGPRNLTDDTSTDGDPSWSPDATRITFTSNRDGDWDIYVMDRNGENVRNLTENDASDWGAQWSPDGSEIVFVSDRDGDAELFTMGADGSNPQQITHNDTDDREPAWSPDGGQIAFVSWTNNYDIYLIDADGENIQNLTADNPYDDDGSPAWSPDGQTIAFQSRRDGRLDIYLLDVELHELRNLTNNPAEDKGPAWAPGGDRLTFSSDRDGNREIYVIDLVSEEIQRLTVDCAEDGNASWNPLDQESLIQLPTTGIGAITVNRSDLRQNPGQEYRLVSQITAEECVTLIQLDGVGEWAQGRITSGDTGWIQLSQIAVTATPSYAGAGLSETAAPPIAPFTPSASDDLFYGVRLVPGNSNIRAEPSTAAEPVGTVPCGQKVTLIGFANGSDGLVWYQLEQGGWVRQDVVFIFSTLEEANQAAESSTCLFPTPTVSTPLPPPSDAAQPPYMASGTPFAPPPSPPARQFYVTIQNQTSCDANVSFGSFSGTINAGGSTSVRVAGGVNGLSANAGECGSLFTTYTIDADAVITLGN